LPIDYDGPAASAVDAICAKYGYKPVIGNVTVEDDEAPILEITDNDEWRVVEVIKMAE
jgi:hypothetical protein